MIIVGGGVIGTEYACMMATLGVRVILTEARPTLLEFVDSEICEALQYRMRSMGVTLRLGERVEEIRVHARRHGAGDAAIRQAPARRHPALLHRAAGDDGQAGIGKRRPGARTTGAA